MKPKFSQYLHNQLMWDTIRTRNRDEIEEIKYKIKYEYPGEYDINITTDGYTCTIDVIFDNTEDRLAFKLQYE